MECQKCGRLSLTVLIPTLVESYVGNGRTAVTQNICIDCLRSM